MSYVAWSVVFGEQPTAAKWNILGDNDASFHDGTGIDDDAIITRHIADGAVLPENLLAGNGSSWNWQTWTPSFNGLTQGSGPTIIARYCRVGKIVFYRLKFVAGTGSPAFSSATTFTLPVAASSLYSNGFGQNILGHGTLRDVSVPATLNVTVGFDTNAIVQAYNVSTGVYSNPSSFFTLQAGDILDMTGFYIVD